MTTNKRLIVLNELADHLSGYEPWTSDTVEFRQGFCSGVASELRLPYAGLEAATGGDWQEGYDLGLMAGATIEFVLGDDDV